MRTGNIGMLVAALAVATVSAAPAWATVTITQGTSAPTYSNLLTFDEVGGPTGNAANNAFAGIGIPNFQSGEGQKNIGDNSGFFVGMQSDNTAWMPFGMILQFDQDVTDMSFQGWDPAGPPGGFGGGAVIFLINDGDENNPVAAEAFTPAWGGVGDEWYNITTSDGMVFDEVRFFGNGFPNDTIVNDISWNIIPEPGSLALLALGVVGIVARRRR